MVYIEHEHHGAMPAAGQLEDVDRLIWRSPTTDHADLRTSGLTNLVVHSIEGPLTIVLPPAMNGVSLNGDLRSIHLEGLTAPDSSVQLWGEVSSGLPSGISRAARLHVSGSAELDLSPLREMSALWELTVRDVPGPVSNTSALAATGTLERIAFYRCYDIDTAGFPEHTALPRLSWISFTEPSSADAKILRSRIDGFWNGHVNRPRSPAWLAAHAGNPLRTWGDDDPAFGRQASRIRWRAQAQMERATTPSARETLIQDLADALDRLAESHPLDTLRREQAGEAVRGLAGANLPPHTR